MTTPTINSINA